VSVPGDATTTPITMTVVNPPADTPAVTIPTPVDDPSREIDALLAQADAYRDYGINKEPGRSLIFPDDESALGLYRQVLAREPDNQAAKAGLGEIAAFYLKSARMLCDRQIWSQCSKIAQDGLKAEPENAELKALSEEAEKKALGG
jgi:serine/threonine-protein kinase PpkA